MRSSTALLLAVALSASAVPVPKKDTRQAKLALREPDVLHVWKHRHFDAAAKALQRRHEDDGHQDRHDHHGDGHWTRSGTWTHKRTGSWSHTDARSAVPRHTDEADDFHRHGQHGRPGRGGKGCGKPEDSPSPPAEEAEEPAPPPGNPNAQAYLDPHNAARARWNANPVTWDDKLAELAQQWVNGCTFEHSGGSLTSEFGYGENLAAGTGEQAIPDAVSGWVNEEAAWNPSNPVFSMETGHFTQVVWKSTTTIGCAYADCSSETGPFGTGYGPTWRLHSCMYTPPGNFGGEYENNVG